MNLSFDIALEALTAQWTPRVGEPTCGPGCSRCCERMTVLISSAEALAVVEGASDWAPQWRSRMKDLKKWVERDDAPEEARDALLDQGPCVFLAGGKCGIYPVRPDSCRACLVWHEPWYCGRTDWQMTTPAELNQLRIESVYARMLAELDQGRTPFWGYLQPAVWAADRYRAEYRAGEDLRDHIPRRWLQTELIEFPTRKRILEELEDHRTEFQRKRPFDQPKGKDIRTREDLAPVREG